MAEDCFGLCPRNDTGVCSRNGFPVCHCEEGAADAPDAAIFRIHSELATRHSSKGLVLECGSVLPLFRFHGVQPRARSAGSLRDMECNDCVVAAMSQTLHSKIGFRESDSRTVALELSVVGGERKAASG